MAGFCSKIMVVAKSGTITPWLGLVAAVCIQILAGNAYNFPLYSHKLKTVLGYNQLQLTNLGVANDVGENVGLLAGLVCNKIPPWSLLLIGAAASFIGYGVIWLLLSQTISPLPYWVVWLALCLATNSATWFNTAVLVTNMRNFPFSRGTLAGILKGYVGLSAAVYTEIYIGVAEKDSVKLLIFLTVGLPAACLLLMYFVRPCTPALAEDSEEHGYFIFIQAMSIVLAFYLLTTALIDDLFSLDKNLISKIFLAFTFLILLAPIGIPIKLTCLAIKDNRYGDVQKSLHLETGRIEEPLLVTEGNVSTSKPVANESLLESPSSENLQSNMPDENGTERENIYLCVAHPSFMEDTDLEILLAEGEGAVRKKRKPRRGEDFKLRQALVKADFWLLFIVYFCGVGSGVTVLNNLAQIGIAEGLDDVTILLSLFSISNFIGRLGGGAVSEYFVRLKAMPRTVWMTVSQAIMIGAHLLFASDITGSLCAGCVLLGICYGVQFSVMVPTASELFGLKHFGMIYNFLSIGNPLGALFFSGLLAGYIYDIEAAEQSFLLGKSDVECVGSSCFRLTFLIMAGVCAVGSLTSIVLTFRLRPVYEMLYARGSFRLPRTDDYQEKK
ncbi:hypothetical protein KI387_026545 [Taxus chinensis]|uniref:Nodulin-like domain-containing protein n=1 Tax=Taxus chinensis TaxID=29808 RepID=A0AA38L866_TAXCH|nr:hypothetical protein KI387_026545 [Taxus chinensis]